MTYAYPAIPVAQEQHVDEAEDDDDEEGGADGYEQYTDPHQDDMVWYGMALYGMASVSLYKYTIGLFLIHRIRSRAAALIGP